MPAFILSLQNIHTVKQNQGPLPSYSGDNCVPLMERIKEYEVLSNGKCTFISHAVSHTVSQ